MRRNLGEQCNVEFPLKTILFFVGVWLLVLDGSAMVSGKSEMCEAVDFWSSPAVPSSVKTL